jgi:hypothetical protein
MARDLLSPRLRLLAALLLPAVAVGAEEAPPPALRVVEGAAFVPVAGEAFAGHDGPSELPVFDAVAADMDLDGDPDLFLNRHHLQPPELYRNLGGRFERVPVERSGLYDNPGVTELFVRGAEMLAGIAARREPGLYLWHDLRRQGCWRFYLASFGAPKDEPPPAEAGDRPRMELSVHANRPITRLELLGPGESRRPDDDDHRLRVPLGRSLADRPFGVCVEEVAGRIEVALEGAEGAGIGIFVGRDHAFAGRRVALWKPDPHGAAWLQVEGSPEPELFLVRGALRGELRPEEEPKFNPFYRFAGGRTLYRLDDEERIPGDYGRGRQVAAVDLGDAAGRLALYVGNVGGPNALLVPDATGYYHDRAGELGLDFDCGASFVWFDVDGDRSEELVYLCRGQLRVADRGAAPRKAGPRFTDVPGARLGLTLREPPGAFFDRTGMHPFDFDRDGRLDLWISGPEGHHLFLRRDRGFADATAEAGLGEIGGSRLLLLLDADDDGRMDAVSVGDEILLLRLGADGRYRGERLDVPGRREEIEAAAAADFDGDRRVDLVLVGRHRHLLRNALGDGTSASAGRSLEVHLHRAGAAPVGALVTARHADGTRSAQRYGSPPGSAFSQTASPARFGSPADNPVTAVGVLWPGAEVETVHPVPPGAAVLHLRW